MKAARNAKLILADGTEFAGFSFGSPRSQAGEVVFTTGMAGYPQSLTDPSFKGQILVATYPLQGNYGVPVDKKGDAILDDDGIPKHFESSHVQAAGFVVSELCEAPSHWENGASLDAWLLHNNTPGIYGIDTRALTKLLREEGSMPGKILVEGSDDVSFESGILNHPVAEVSPKETKVFHGKTVGAQLAVPLKIALIDCGAKANIYRCLLNRSVEVISVPWNHDLSDIEYDGLFLSNGPGDPKACNKTIATVRKAFSRGKPIFGICLGNQIMALAAGADTYKLPYGHRGQNQPCVELPPHSPPASGGGSGGGRCYITSQNHGYAVREDSLPAGWEPWFVNNNDNTNEGIRCVNKPFSAVQFHPEGCPGPRDTEFLIDRFLMQCRGE
ncbi:MAG: glutamine-hydrolyzing carbamoyl-phosphate synthase small subunit [Spirochaetaceae bacterium]|jgi:carbamoyl-phosphate synthase small subunit|nr:glutamine-hydrolyzing carbamoyl-phosphate synthase small subunit [Spirochaetaceae bacterium]